MKPNRRRLGRAATALVVLAAAAGWAAAAPAPAAALELRSPFFRLPGLAAALLGPRQGPEIVLARAAAPLLPASVLPAAPAVSAPVAEQRAGLARALQTLWQAQPETPDDLNRRRLSSTFDGARIKDRIGVK